jgi:hypothetical protein
MSTVCLLLIDDGREDYLDRTLEALGGRADAEVIVRDDDHSLGFAGAIQQGWELVLDSGCRYVFHVETDFTFNEDPPVDRMVKVLEEYPYLAQIALKRQAWNDQEKAAGGIVECNPDDFEERGASFRSGEEFLFAAEWTEHRRFFTTNPSVYPARLCLVGWPQEPHSEGVFTHRLLTDPLLRFAFWGGKFDPPLVEHQGARAGIGY